MPYDNPHTISHAYGSVDFGTAAAIYSTLQGPAGKVGKLREIMVTAKEVFTTGGDILAGIAQAGVDYVDMPLSTLALGDTLLMSDVSGALALENFPADTAIELTWNPTGGTPTGIADVVFVVDWY